MEFLNKKVIKRDGQIVSFDFEKIKRAILLATQHDEDFDTSKLNGLFGSIKKIFKDDHKEVYEIEDIQKVIEEQLIKFNFYDVARIYIEYRANRDYKREKNSKFVKELESVINLTNKEVTNENSNKDSRVLNTQRDLIAGTVCKSLAKFILPKHIFKEQGKTIHIHDLDYAPTQPMTNCCLVNIKDMLENGFKMGNADILTPNSIGVATTVVSQIIAGVSSSQYGGTTINRIDEVLAPYVKKSHEKNIKLFSDVIEDKEKLEQKALEKTKKDVYDAFQTLEYQINTLFTTNGQTPFCTVAFGNDSSFEGRLIQEAILQVRYNGLGAEKKTAIFPKLVFFLQEGINLNPEDPNYDIKQLAMKTTAKRMYPDYISLPNNKKITGSQSGTTAPMGCRSFLSQYINEHGQEEIDGRFNLGVVTVNLPRLALMSRQYTKPEKRLEKFYSNLEKALNLSKEANLFRIESMKDTTASVAPILWTEGGLGRLQPHEKISTLFHKASVSIGFIGIHETIQALFGKDIYEDEKLKQIGEEIVEFMNKKCKEYKNETGYGFSLYSTPAESLCSKFCAQDVKDFGIVEEVNSKGYYTNSWHQDVRRVNTPFEKIDFECKYPFLATGGNIHIIELPDVKKNLKVMEQVIDYAYKKTHYFSFNTPIDKCFECGLEAEMKADENGYYCPDCGNRDPNKLEVICRMNGYLSQPALRPFPTGKQIEVTNRVKHIGTDNIKVINGIKRTDLLTRGQVGREDFHGNKIV